MDDRAQEFQIVLTTAGSEDQARSIARELVERGLAACVHVAAAGMSIYRWQGQIEEEEERLLVIKSATDLFDRVRSAIRELHSYEVPEILAVPLTDGDADYLRWLAGSLAVDR